MKLEVPNDFLAPSCLDYGAYCRTVERGGFAADDLLSQAMACAQEAREWKKNGNFDLVTPENLVQNEVNEIWLVSPNKAAIKYAIHSMGFVLCQFKSGLTVVGCGYDKHGIIVCHPSDKKFGKWGKKQVPWAEISTDLEVAWGVF